MKKHPMFDVFDTFNRFREEMSEVLSGARLSREPQRNKLTLKGVRPTGSYAVIARLTDQGVARVGTVDGKGNEVSLALTDDEAEQLVQLLLSRTPQKPF